MLDDNNTDHWKISHEPSFPKLKNTINEFIKEVINVPEVIPRIEGEFRNDHTKLVLEYVKKQEDMEKSGSNGYGRSNNEMMMQQMTEEEKRAYRLQ